MKMDKEKGATSPEIEQNMPKISEIAPKITKRTDIFGINPIVSIWSGRPDSNRRSSAPKADAITKLRYAPKPTYFPLAHDGKQEKDDLFRAKRGTHVAKIYAMGF